MSEKEHWVNQTLRLRRLHWQRSIAIGLGIVGVILLSLCLVGHCLPEDLPLFPTLWALMGGAIVLLGLLLWATKPLWAVPVPRLICRPPWVELFDANGRRRVAAFNLENPHALLMVLRESPPAARGRYGVVPSLWVEVYLAQGEACLSWYAPWVPPFVKGKDGTLEISAPTEVKRRLARLVSLLAEPPWRAGMLRWRMTWPVDGKRRWVALPAAQYEVVRPPEGLEVLLPLLEALDAYADANSLQETIARVRSTGAWEALAGAFPKRCFG